MLAGIIYGASKTGATGVSVLLIPVMLHYFTPGQSLGIALPLLIFADLCALVLLRRSVNWRIVAQTMPCAFVGVYFGWRVLAYAQAMPDGTGDEMLRQIIACVMLFVVVSGGAMRYARERNPEEAVDSAAPPRLTPGRRLFAVCVAIFGGIVTMLANNGGPPFVLYLMIFRLNKFYFLGTAAWIFCILNISKMPFSIQLGYVTMETLRVNLLMVPFVLVGVAAGRWAMTRMSQRLFDNTVQILSLAGAVYLLFRTFL